MAAALLQSGQAGGAIPGDDHEPRMNPSRMSVTTTIDASPVVRALEIARIVPAKDSEGATIVPADEGCSEFFASESYMTKHEPQVGGYYVIEDNESDSFSPKAAFENEYTRL